MKKRQTLLYVLIAMVFACIIFIVIRSAPGSAIDTVPVILPSADPNGDSSAEETPIPTEQTIAISADNVQIVLQTISRAENYSRILTVENFWSGGSDTQSYDVAVRGASTRLTISSASGSPVRHVLIHENEKWIWYSDSTDFYHGLAQENDSDRYQSLLSYEEILQLDRGDILDAGAKVYDGVMCIYVRYVSGALGYEHHAYIDINSGLLFALESYDGDKLFYRMNSTVPDLSTPEDELFVHP